MAWRLHLTNQAIQHLDILKGEPSLLAIWPRRNRVVFHSLEMGTAIGEKELNAPGESLTRQSESWREFHENLRSPNGSYLPYIQNGTQIIHSTEDGRLHLFQAGNDLSLSSDGREKRLELGEGVALLTAALDPLVGLIAALTDDNKLHIYQQHIRVGSFDLAVKQSDEMRPAIAVARGGSPIFVTDGSQMVIVDSAGNIRHHLEMSYQIRLMACSPDGKILVTCDRDIGLIRVYQGADFTLTHQRFAIDLMAQATQVQLIADMPPAFVAPGALVTDNNGRVALAMAGVVCVSELSQMDTLPGVSVGERVGG